MCTLVAKKPVVVSIRVDVYIVRISAISYEKPRNILTTTASRYSVSVKEFMRVGVPLPC